MLIKAVAGGGGKGMKRIDKVADFEASLASAKREAKAAFGDERVLLEKYVEAPRHIEMQVFADRHGNVVHLFERDCSLQRRHQKVVEEAPAPGMTTEVRAAMGKAATEAARAVGYEGAGTVEFIADGRGGLKADRFYFMEMNTRLQVEHPVTEAITGLDLVALQLRVAAGEKLPFAQADIKPRGHAVEARLYAEDPEKRFLPSTGKIYALRFPAGQGIRVDTGVEEGGEVTPFYDPMIAKVIAHAPTRLEALDRLAAALGDTLVAGPKTNVAFLKKLCEAPAFRNGAFDTGFIDQNLEALGAVARPLDAEAVRLGALALVNDRWAAHFDGRDPTRPDAASPWDNFDAFQLGPARRQTLKLTVDNKPQAVELAWGEPAARFEGVGLAVSFGGGRTTYARFSREDARQFVRAGNRLIVVRDGSQTSIVAEDPFRGGHRASRRRGWRRDLTDARQAHPASREVRRQGEEGRARRRRRGHEDGARTARAPGRHRVGDRRRGGRAGEGGRAADADRVRSERAARSLLTWRSSAPRLRVSVDKLASHVPAGDFAIMFGPWLSISSSSASAATRSPISKDWIDENRAHHRRLGRKYEQKHTTRMVPKRIADLDGGSLYWVIKGIVACRQPLLGVKPFTDKDGIGRCHLLLDPVVIPVEPRPSRPFQGWRYLAGKDAPA